MFRALVRAAVAATLRMAINEAAAPAEKARLLIITTSPAWS
jgi:hypothetical protein